MGAADIVPGVSGGTMALITGIYEKLIDAIKSLTIIPRKIIEDRSLKPILEQEWKFLISLGIGIASAIFVASFFIPALIEKYPALVYSFFIGLIAASSIVIFKKITQHNFKSWLFLVLGVFFGVAISLLAPAQVVEPSLLYVFIVGFIAISAMILPGISGSYLLLILGLYTYILESLHMLAERFVTLIVFGLGIVLGISVLSHILSWLLHHKESVTLAALVGIMIGSLTRIGSEVVANTNSANGWIFVVVLAVIGVMIVLWIESATHMIGNE